MRTDCAGGTLVSTKKLKSVEGITRPDHRRLERIASELSGKNCEIVVRDVLGHDFS